MYVYLQNVEVETEPESNQGLKDAKTYPCLLTSWLSLNS